MKKLLIVTGPQGSGNHLWSKIFSEDPKVNGWSQLTQEYWVGHGDEPFSDIWEDPSIFNDHEWNGDFYYTSISCPYIIVGGPEMDQDGGGRVPKYKEFIDAAETAGFEIILAVIGRDKNILEHQQLRIRKTKTTDRFLSVYDQLIENYNPVFISTELLYLYKSRYLRSLEKLLNFPINISSEKLDDILKDNANAKYIKPVDHYWLDDLMKSTAKTHGLENNQYKYKKIK